MFEYLDHGVVASSIAVFFAASIAFINSKHPFLYVLGIIFILVSFNIYVWSDIKSTIESNTAQFKKGTIFTCRADDHNKYRVSNKEWQLYEDAFMKDSLMIRADKCEVK